MSKLIVIVGATGGQGGAVVNAFLSDEEFKVRGITRNVNSDKAKALASRGVEMVTADLGDESSLDLAFAGAYAIFAITDYYEHFFKHGKDFAMEKEFLYGTNMAKAAARVPTLQRYVWSTLPYTSKVTGGKAIAPHFEGKGRVDEYMRDNLPSLVAKTTFCIFAIFAQNMEVYPIFRPVWVDSAKKWVQFWPAPSSAPYASLGDYRTNTGIFVRAIVRNPPAAGTYVRCAIEDLTLESSIALWGKASGKGVAKAVQISVEDYVDLWGHMGEEQASQWLFFRAAMELGITRLPGMIEGLDLLSEDEKTSLVSTEEAWRRMDWSFLEEASGTAQEGTRSKF